MSTIITIVGLLVLIAIAVNLVQRMVQTTRDMRNNIRSTMGKNTAEFDKANEILDKASKNGLALKWAAVDAYKALTKYYDEDSSISYVQSYLQQNGLQQVDVPRSFYKEPGCQKIDLIYACNAYFASFDFKAMNQKEAITDRDFATFNNLKYMWYFADDSVRTLEEAAKEVQECFNMYCIKNNLLTPKEP